MFRAPLRFLWFLRGSADSDGRMHNLRNKRVEMVSSPNTYFITTYSHRWGIKSIVRFSLGYGRVTVTCVCGRKIQIFNPATLTIGGSRPGNWCRPVPSKDTRPALLTEEVGA